MQEVPHFLVDDVVVTFAFDSFLVEDEVPEGSVVNGARMRAITVDVFEPGVEPESADKVGNFLLVKLYTSFSFFQNLCILTIF